MFINRRDHQALPEAYAGLSQVYEDLNQFQEAIEAHKQMIQLVYHKRVSLRGQKLIGHWYRPLEDEFLDYNHLGRLYTEDGQYEKAIEAHQYAIRLRPRDPMLYHNLGLTHLKSGDKESALDQYNILVGMWQVNRDDREKEILQQFFQDLLNQIQNSP